ncbi:MAG: hypothetical protein PF481_11740 [Bacteroidales bacterium]|jgi:hypothetical protein|nr:hypothetical protein [Bacteroidales bacterium]
MKQILIILAFIFLYCQTFSQEKTSYSVGFFATNVFSDYGGYITYNRNKHAIRFNCQYITRKYEINEYLTPGPTSGFGLGLNYVYQFFEYPDNKVYKPKISIGYLYRELEGSEYVLSYGNQEHNFDVYQKTNEINFGYINSFNVKKIEIQINPYFCYYKEHGKKIDMIFYTYEDSGTRVIDMGTSSWDDWDYKISLEISVGYRF